MSDGHVPLRAGRYRLHGEIASGGMATVHFGQMVGAHGFSRVVAIKRMLPRLARDPRFHAMFVDEAKLASRVQHPNVVSILDVVDEDGEIMIVMDYVRGAALSTLLGKGLERGELVPVDVLANIGGAMLAGLHAAHEARDRRGRPLGIVHRDVSPQNVLVGVDGVARIMDFGIARATELLQADDQELTGKVHYMAPEQFLRTGVDRRTDVFATGVVLWSALAGRRLFRSTELRAAIDEVVRCEVPELRQFRDDVPPALETALRRALSADREQRFESAEEFASALEAAASPATTRAVADWVKSLVGSIVSERERAVVEIEKTRTVMTVALAADAELSELPTLEREPTLDDVGEQAPSLPKRGSRLAMVGVTVLGLAATVAVGSVLITAGRDAETTIPSAAAPPVPSTELQPAMSGAGAVIDAAVAPDAGARSRDAGRRAVRARPPPKTRGDYLPSKP